MTKYPPQLVRAIELALKHKEDLSVPTSLKEVNIEQGQSVGGVFTLLQVARRCGIEKAPGTHRNGKLDKGTSVLKPSPITGIAPCCPHYP